jgi:hypothetical protein
MMSIAAWAILGSLALGQLTWAKDDWRSWSESDCRKILEDSPWSRTWYHPDGDQKDNLQRDPTFSPETKQERELREKSPLPQTTTRRESYSLRTPGGIYRALNSPQVYYIVRFQSALPVRQAVVRMAQIQSGYDKMSADQKKDVDASAEAFINRKYDEEIVFQVSYGSSSSYGGEFKKPFSMEPLMNKIWKQYPENAPPEGIALITSAGLRVKPLRISEVAGKMAFLLYFPRRVNGELLLSQSLNFVKIELPHPDLTLAQESQPDPERQKPTEGMKKVMRPALVSVEFKLDKMKLNGEVTY